jgi:hypothetical protein
MWLLFQLDGTLFGFLLLSSSSVFQSAAVPGRRNSISPPSPSPVRYLPFMSDTTKIKRQFLNSLKRGTGEAYLIVRDNPNIDFSTQIIKGVLNILAYDGQSEGSRGKYIFDIISISKRKDKIRKAVLKGLATEQNDTWNLTHLFDIAKIYAENGDIEARQAIYDRFLNHPIDHSDWVGYSEILELDGLQGLFFIAEKFGKYIEQNPDNWQDDNIIRQFQEKNQDLKVENEIEKVANSNKYIRLYLDTIKKTKTSQEKHRKKSIQYTDIIDEVLNSKPFISFFRKRKLVTHEVNQIAEKLLTETDKSNIEKLLDIFDFHKFPFDSNLILSFAKQKRNSENQIVENAIDALKHLKSKGIREFALDKILNSKNSFDYLEILISNYEIGDFKLLSKIVNKTNDEHKIERLAGVYTDIYKANKSTECKEPFEILYSKMNCGIHRNGIIELLIENNILSDKIREEIKFDSDLETRKLLDKKENGR